MVSGASYSASASLPPFESTRLTLKVKPMRSGSAGRRRRAPGLTTSPWPLGRALDDRVQRLAVVEPLARGGGEQAGPRLQRRQRVDLQQVDAPVLADAEVDPADVADAQRAHRHLRDGAQARHDVARQIGRAAHRDLAGVGRLQPVVVEVEAAARRRVDDVVDRQQDPLVAAPLQKRDGDVGAGHELLDQHAARVGAQRARQDLGQRARVAHDRVVGDPLRRPFVVRLDDHRQRQPQRPRIAHPPVLVGREQLRARRVDAALAQHQLGQPLVQRDRQDVGVRAGVGEPQLLEQRRVERLARAPAPPLGAVEDQIGSVRFDARRQPRGGAGDLDLLDLVTAGAQAVGDGVDGLDAVELGLVFAVGQPQVVREGNAHGEPLQLCLAVTLTGFRRARRALRRPSRPASSDRRWAGPDTRRRRPRTPPVTES